MKFQENKILNNSQLASKLYPELSYDSARKKFEYKARNNRFTEKEKLKLYTIIKAFFNTTKNELKK